MKKFLKLTTVVVSMVMALTFVSCADGNENSNDEPLNLVGTYGLSRYEAFEKSSTEEATITMTMPASTSFRRYGTIKIINDGKTSVQEMDVTVTKTADGYSFNWAKYDVDGVAQGEDAKAVMEKGFNDKSWNHMNAMFAMTLTTTAEGTWSYSVEPETSGTYTVDEANSKVRIEALIEEGETLTEPVIIEATYSNNGKTLVVVQGDSYGDETSEIKMTFIRK